MIITLKLFIYYYNDVNDVWNQIPIYETSPFIH